MSFTIYKIQNENVWLYGFTPGDLYEYAYSQGRGSFASAWMRWNKSAMRWDDISIDEVPREILLYRRLENAN